jgi:hypothetical protein
LGIFRIIGGALFCLAAAVLTVFFVDYGYNLTDYALLGTTDQYYVIFAQLLSPVTAIQLGHYVTISALGLGALIGGLLSKGPTAGLIVGLIAFGVIFMLFLGLTVGFDFNAWIAWVTTYGSNVVGDLALAAGILGGVGAIGGKLTSDQL